MNSVKILLPDKYGEDIEYALREAEFFLPLAGVSVGGGEWVLSLGNTSLAKENAVKAANDLYDDGFVIKTVGKVWFIVAPDERGVLFGVYEWLKDLAGLEVYASDEFEIGKFTLKAVDKTINPSLCYRSRAWYVWNKYDKQIFNRLRYTDPKWITFAHTMLSILPKSKYYAEHPEYYATPMAQQLCFTNEEMTDAFIKEALNRYITPENLEGRRTSLFFVGQEDNAFFCQCEKCKAAYAKYGLSGTMLLFVKKVAKAVNEHVKKYYPDKIVKTLTFAYGQTNNLPVDENYKPIDESLIFEKNMGIMITVGTHDMDESRIKRNERYIKACKALGGEPYLWSYDSVFDDELIYLETFDCMDFYNKAFVANGTVMHYDQGHYSANISFDEMSNYVRAKKMWDISLDKDALIRDFVRAFYKEGAKQVFTYYEEMRELQKSWKFDASLFVRTSPKLKSTEAFPKDKLICFTDILTDGVNAAKDKKVKMRIARERLTPLYLLVELYGEELDKKFLKNLIDTFSQDVLENNVAYYAEHGPENYNKDMHAKITQWRALLI